MSKVKVLELFAGIGACSKALTNLGIEYEIVDAVEIDKYAIKSFNAIHNTNFEPQDITKWNKHIDCDLIMHGSPCQDFSIAGKQAGGDQDSGTRSSLMYETLRIVEKIKPKYVIWENVKNLLSKKHRHNFDVYIASMQRLGYNSYFKVLNAKDYGVPQNRERVFTVSIRNDGNFDSFFEFPDPIPLEKKLKDVLEKEVDEKYYVSTKQLTGMATTNYESYKLSKLLKDKDTTADTLKAGFEGCPQLVSTGGTELQRKVCDEALKKGVVKPNDVIEHTVAKPCVIGGIGEKDSNGGRQWKMQNRVYDNGVATSVTGSFRPYYKEEQKIAETDGVAIRTANKQGYDLAQDGDGIDLAYPSSNTRRGRVGHGVSKTLACSDTMGTLQGYRIRKLTPKECWRLMGFDDSDYEKASKVCSKTQLYKQAGNSIVVNVLQAILKELLK